MPASAFVDLAVVEYVAQLFAAGFVGRGVYIREDGSPGVWLFGHWQREDVWWGGVIRQGG